MKDHFETEKCLHVASTDNSVLTIIDNRPDPQETPGKPSGNTDGTNPGTRAENTCKIPGVSLGHDGVCN